MSIGGQSSGDFRLGTSALRVLYSFVKDSIMSLAADGFTQSNPNVVTGASEKSSTIPANVKKGVLGGSVAFTRPDVGPNAVGGAVQVSSAYVQNTRPVGLFLNDAAGNAFENTPGPASGKGPYLRGGSCGNKLYETQVQTALGASVGIAPMTSGKAASNSAGGALSYSEGDFLYASVNGYLTNVWQDSYEAAWIHALTLGSGSGGEVMESDCTRMGVLLAPPNATSSEMLLALYPL